MNRTSRDFFLFIALQLAASMVSASSGSPLSVRVDFTTDAVTISLRNDGENSALVADRFVLSGPVGGNVIPIISSVRGELRPPCNYSGSFVDEEPTRKLAPGRQIRLFRTGALTISRLHCLEAGSYSLVFGYMQANKRLVFSRSLTLLIGEDGAASFAE
jgi:hypothetical protein